MISSTDTAVTVGRPRGFRRLAVTGLVATLAAMVVTTLAAALARAAGVDFEIPDGGGETIPLGGFAVVTGFFSLVALTQAACDRGLVDGLEVLVVADGLARLEGEAGVRFAEKAAVLGACRDIPLELPGVALRAKLLRDLGVDDPSGYEVLNSRNSPMVGRAVDHLYAKLQRRGMLRREVERLVNQDRNYFAAAMLALGEADAMITGTTRPFSQSLRQVQMVIG